MGCFLLCFVFGIAGLAVLPLILLTSVALVFRLALPVIALVLIISLVRKQG